MGRARRSSLKRTADSRLYWRNNEEAIPHFHSLLNLTDVVFISLDIEGRCTIGNSRLDEIGVAILDTRRLVERSELISSRHICTRYRGENFLFGNSERRGARNIATFIRSLFYIEDIDQSVSLRWSFRKRFRADFHQTKSSDPPRLEDNAIPSKKHRDIVLVGHGIRGDISMLTEFQVDVQDILPVVDVVDTEIIGRAVYEKGLKLVALLECLGCPHAKLPNAGNDATFALRAFLALAIKTQWLGRQQWLSQFQRVAFAPVKDTGVLNEKSAKEIAYQRAKRMQDRQDKGKDWADTLGNQLPWDDI